jgi:hypothetical protein
MIGDIIEIERAKRTVYEDLPVAADAPTIVGDMSEGEGHSGVAAEEAALVANRVAGQPNALDIHGGARARP